MEITTQITSLQKFASVHASVNDHFNAERCLTTRPTFKLNRTATIAKLWQFCINQSSLPISKSSLTIGWEKRPS